ncbi:MAG TPA: LppX_LprAFG lipoprotein [Candidatus Dormibacteraeota bacterium]|nr:LppX_LprAFG lipoprotein [Candidatus Dormibacteraeota bacterium]
MKTRVAVASLLSVAALAAACGGLQPEDPALALKQGGAAIGGLKTVTATLKVTKGTISFQGFALVSATAGIRLPDQSDTVYLVRQQDVQIGLEVVIISGHVFLKPPLLRFEPLTAAQAADIPDLSQLFDPQTGLPAIIPQGRSPKYLGVETIDDVDSHRVEATYTSDQVRGMLAQLSSQGDVDAIVWVGGSDHYIRKAVLSGKFGDNGSDATIEVDLKGFNGTVNIASPGRTG